MNHRQFQDICSFSTESFAAWLRRLMLMLLLVLLLIADVLHSHSCCTPLSFFRRVPLNLML